MRVGILDVFGGSGTTLVAAERTGRRGAAIEIDPAYCDVIVDRLAKVAGVDAVHDMSGKTFAELAAERGSANDARAATSSEEVAA